MNRRYVLLLAFCMAGTMMYAQNGKKKPAVKKVKGSTQKKVVTEAEAKKLHEDQLAMEGKQNERRAYKRSDFEASPTVDEVPIGGQGQLHQAVAINPTPKAGEATTTPSKVKVEPKPPRFIETIVLERKDG